MKKIILHLCADIGSDSYFYDIDPDYEVIKIGKSIGVENIFKDGYTDSYLNIFANQVHGIIANPPCTEFSTARSNGKARENSIGLYLVNTCERIIKICNPEWWVMENPSKGTLKKYMGSPHFKYEPWQFGSPYTKLTALWGKFTIPKIKYEKWEDVPKNKNLYIRPGRKKPSLAFLHKSAIHNIPEFKPFIDKIKNDSDFRSLCSQGFAKAFYEVNK